ncbi:MAG TPA: hypothetical protein VGI40_17680 [Pirellulaceae bacterium]|jgi:hypothetical protein
MAGAANHIRASRFLCGMLLFVSASVSRADDSGSSDDRPRKLQVDFWVVEVPIDKLRNLGFDWAQITAGGVKHTRAENIESITQASFPADQLLPFLKSLEQNSLARTLCHATLITLDGRPASLAIHNSLEFDVVPISLGSGDIRLEYRVKISPDSSKQNTDQTMPRPASFQLDAASEIELGKTSLLSHIRKDKPLAAGKSQPTEVLVFARVDVVKSGGLPTRK